MTDARIVLALNSGSSSLKFALYHITANEQASLVKDAIEQLDQASPGGSTNQRDGVRRIFETLAAHGYPKPDAIGHRIVHGGPDYAAPQRIDASLLAALRRLAPLAPLHLPPEIELIEAVAVHCPDRPQVACFDTAFHRAMPELAQRFPLPEGLWTEGVRRYGFHGLSYEYVLGVLGNANRTIIAHLGNGSSLVAIDNGRAVDTTMGLTPIGGVVMGTRSGDLDPGVLLYLSRQKHYDTSRLERLLNDESGLRGVSGTTSDMKTLIERRQQDPRAALAVAMFCNSVRKHIGAFAAVLGGVETLVFTGGIGEHAAEVRWEICRGLEHLGVRLHPERNARHADPISTDASTCSVRVIATNEDLQIARHTYALVTSTTSAA